MSDKSTMIVRETARSSDQRTQEEENLIAVVAAAIFAVAIAIAAKSTELAKKRKRLKESEENGETPIENDSTAAVKPNTCTVVPFSTETALSTAPLPIGWQGKRMRLQMRYNDTKIKLQTTVSLATFDQMDQRASGKGACSVIAANTAHWLLTHPRCSAPNKYEHDELIRFGSAQWRSLCKIPTLTASFPNHHFDMETVEAAEVRPIVICNEQSHIGFFGTEQLLPEATDKSVDRVWDKIKADVAAGDTEARVYIIGWNDHFFVLKAERDAFYIVDSLGSRLGCKTGYVVKFDSSSVVTMWEETEEDTDGKWVEVCSGIDCCREFLKRFLAAGAVKELELENQKSGPLKPFMLYRKLLIDFKIVALKN